MSCATRSRVQISRRALSQDESSGERSFFMKKIECYAEASEVQQVLSALMKTGIGGVTVCPEEGKTKIVIVALDIEVEYVVGTILEATNRRSMEGDDISVFPIEEAIRIRTGEKGAKAVF